MPKTPKRTAKKKVAKRVAKVFVDVICYKEDGSVFSLDVVNSAVRYANPDTPSQNYEIHLSLATEMGLIERVEGKPDTYRRLAYLNLPREKAARLVPYVRKDLYEKIVFALEERLWLD